MLTLKKSAENKLDVEQAFKTRPDFQFLIGTWWECWWIAQVDEQELEYDLLHLHHIGFRVRYDLPRFNIIHPQRKSILFAANYGAGPEKMKSWLSGSKI